MILVKKNDIPVACYGDIGPRKALRSYADENLPGANIANILINNEGIAIMEWQGKKYDAEIYLDIY